MNGGAGIESAVSAVARGASPSGNMQHVPEVAGSSALAGQPAEVAPAVPAVVASSRVARKPRCADCFFEQNLLCALPVKKPCPTFRAAHPDGLRPPQQLAFVFRHDRRV
jgi:hypothetical protein